MDGEDRFGEDVGVDEASANTISFQCIEEQGHTSECGSPLL